MLCMNVIQVSNYLNEKIKSLRSSSRSQQSAFKILNGPPHYIKKLMEAQIQIVKSSDESRP